MIRKSTQYSRTDGASIDASPDIGNISLDLDIIPPLPLESSEPSPPPPYGTVLPDPPTPPRQDSGMVTRNQSGLKVMVNEESEDEVNTALEDLRQIQGETGEIASLPRTEEELTTQTV